MPVGHNNYVNPFNESNQWCFGSSLPLKLVDIQSWVFLTMVKSCVITMNSENLWSRKHWRPVQSSGLSIALTKNCPTSLIYWESTVFSQKVSDFCKRKINKSCPLDWFEMINNSLRVNYFSLEILLLCFRWALCSFRLLCVEILDKLCSLRSSPGTPVLNHSSCWGGNPAPGRLLELISSRSIWALGKKVLMFFTKKMFWKDEGNSKIEIFLWKCT